MNDLVKFGSGGLPANPEDLQAGLQHVSAGLSGRSGGMPYLRLLRDGVYAYGQENIEPQEGSEWAVNPHSFQHGFACWGDNELLGEAMVPMNQPPPNINDLQDFGCSWDQQISFQLQCLNGEDTGVVVLYKGTSVGYLNAAKELIDRVVTQLQHEPAKYVPVVALEADSYNHKKYGKIYYPVLDVIRWISIDGDPAPAAEVDEADENHGGGDAPTKETAAKSGERTRRGRAAAEPADEPGEDDADDAENAAAGDPDPAPSRSRRRRRAS